MKLLVVGSSPQSQIYLASTYVSGYHAEIVLMDNGDILLSDIDSTNGTFLNGQRLTPKVEVSIRRGDNVVFADTPLNWSLVPTIEVEQDVKQVIGIGSNSKNPIHVAGDKVSRFHATLKQYKNGKWFIIDHSTNGTAVNNQRIPKDTPVRIKAGDTIKCAGMAVRNPIPKQKKWWIIPAAAAACLLLVFTIGNLISGHGTNLNPEKIYQEYAPSTVLIYMGYHYRITAGSLNVDMAFGGSEFILSDNTLVSFSGESQEEFATGFYISEDGLIATNLHVAKPWLFDKKVQPVEDLVRSWLNDLARTQNSNYANYISQVKVEGIIDYMYAIPHDAYFDGHNAMTCIEVASSDDTDIDVAVLRAMLPEKKLPGGTKCIHLKNIPNKKSYKSGSKIYTIGFPMAIALQDINNRTLEAQFSEGSMSSSNNQYDFGHSAEATNGSSGSPVFNKRGQLIGVVSSGLGNGYNFAVRSEYLKKLLDQHSVEY